MNSLCVFDEREAAKPDEAVHMGTPFLDLFILIGHCIDRFEHLEHGVAK
jgi:hypothetical protein